MGGYSVESNIENTSHYLLNQIIEKRTEIMNILIECASKCPEKITIYSTLIGLLNSQNSNFVEDVNITF
jgi:nuclear cap-binding protein subunit 1